MIYVVAVIDLKPDKVDEFLEICAKEYIPALTRLGRKFIAQWTTAVGTRYQVINLWAHDDMAQLERFWEARYVQDKETIEIMTRLTPLIHSEFTNILIPTPISPLK